MDDLKNSNIKLHDDDTNEVAGGYAGDTQGHIKDDGVIRCDNCFTAGAIPVNGGHLCLNCLEKLKNIVGQEAISNFLTH